MKIFANYAKNTKDGGFEKYCKVILEKLNYKCELTPSTGDGGVDIIATDINGNCIGVQCKNWECNIGPEVIRALAGSIVSMKLHSGMVFCTSNFTASAKKEANNCNITLWNYTNIEQIAASLGIDPNKDCVDENEENNLLTESVLFDHNKEVYKQLEYYLANDNKALVVLGTGLGKTTTALEYCYRHSCRALVICPKKIICDDWNNNICVDTMTYSSFSYQYKDINYNNYGVVIFDEVHHSGASTWGAGVQYVINNKIKVIGLTATKDRLDGIDVAVQLFDNNICQGYDVLDGISCGILHPFSYVGAYYDAEKVCDEIKQRYGDRLNEYLVGELDTALNNTPTVKKIILNNMPSGKRKGIIFVESVEEIDDGIKLIKDVYPDLEYRAISSNMTKEQLKENKNWFEHTEEGYLCSINMVSEGIHYQNVNTLFMLRRTKSSIIFQQQLGRVVTIVTKKDPNAIVFDFVNNAKTVREFSVRVRHSLINNGRIPSLDNIRVVTDNRGFNTDYGISKQIIFKEYVSSIEKVLESIQRSFYGRPWTEEEDNKLILEYPIKKYAVFKEFPNRTEKALAQRVKKLGLTKDVVVHWTKEMDEIIKKYYEEDGPQKVANMLKIHRSSVMRRAKKLGLVFNDVRKVPKKDREIIKQFYKTEGAKVKKRLSREYTDDAVQLIARRMGEHCENRGIKEKDKQEILRLYPTMGKKVLEKFPEYNYNQIRVFVKKCNIKFIGDTHASIKKKIVCIETNELFESITQAAKSINKHPSSFNSVLNNKNKTLGGYHWEYMEENNG